MTIKKHLFFLLFSFFFFLSLSLSAFGGREREAPVAQVTGIVRLVGTSLFPEIVISNSDSEWYVAMEERQKLYNYQHRIVTVEGEETVIELTFANGMSAGTRRELRNIRIISVAE